MATPQSESFVSIAFQTLSINVGDNSWLTAGLLLASAVSNRVTLSSKDFKILPIKLIAKSSLIKTNCLSTKTFIKFVVVLALSSSKGSKATPIVQPVVVAFVATPAIEEGAKRSPTAIIPPSPLTFIGTRPDKATGTCLSPLKPESPNPPSKRPGLVEITPRMAGAVVVAVGLVLAILPLSRERLYLFTNTGFSISAITNSPATKVSSLVG